MFTPCSRNHTAPQPATALSTAAGVAALVDSAPDKKLGPTTNGATGHSEWPDGRGHDNAPRNANVQVTAGGVVYNNCDVNTHQEGRSATLPTFAVITARSYHTGVVNVALMDGSVRSVRDGISLETWRAGHPVR